MGSWRGQWPEARPLATILEYLRVHSSQYMRLRPCYAPCDFPCANATTYEHDFLTCVRGYVWIIDL